MCLPLVTGQGIRWCITVIRHQAVNSKRRYIRWNRDILMMNNVNEDGAQWGESVPCSKSATDFAEREMLLWLRTLPSIQYEVLYGLYVLGLTQSEVAKRLNMSQQHVCRLKNKGLARLRKEMNVS